MTSVNPVLDQAGCLYLVTRYLYAQGWQLVSPQVLSASIWSDLKIEDLSEANFVERVESQVWQRYAVFIHECCRRPDDGSYQRAWSELSDWLRRQSVYLHPTPQEPQVIVQETLAYLYTYLKTNSLRTPAAFWAFANQALKNKHRDLHRRRTALIRDHNNEIYLSEITDGVEGEDYYPTEVHRPGMHDSRDMETEVSNKEIRTQLQAFFRQILPTLFQQRIAEACFLDGLSPKQIAQLMGKKPHEIRMAKARLVQTLRDLPPQETQRLDTILGDQHPRDEAGGGWDHPSG